MNNVLDYLLPALTALASMGAVAAAIAFIQLNRGAIMNWAWIAIALGAFMFGVAHTIAFLSVVGILRLPESWLASNRLETVFDLIGGILLLGGMLYARRLFKRIMK